MNVEALLADLYQEHGDLPEVLYTTFTPIVQQKMEMLHVHMSSLQHIEKLPSLENPGNEELPCFREAIHFLEVPLFGLQSTSQEVEHNERGVAPSQDGLAHECNPNEVQDLEGIVRAN